MRSGPHGEHRVQNLASHFLESCGYKTQIAAVWKMYKGSYLMNPFFSDRFRVVPLFTYLTFIVAFLGLFVPRCLIFTEIMPPNGTRAPLLPHTQSFPSPAVSESN